MGIEFVEARPAGGRGGDGCSGVPWAVAGGAADRRGGCGVVEAPDERRERPFARLESLMHGDPAAVRRVLGAFVIQHSGDADRFAELWAAGHLPGVRKLANTLRRNASQIGVAGLPEAARALEAVTETAAAVEAALASVRSELAQVIDAAQDWIAAHPAPAQATGDTAENVADLLAKLNLMVDARDGRAIREAERIAHAARLQLTPAQLGRLDAVLQALRRFGFAEAAAGLANIRRALG